MNIAIITFSEYGAMLGSRIGMLTEHKTKCYISCRHMGKKGFEPFDSVCELTDRLFSEVDALVFVGACGIAVRAIAPLVKSKLTDPAVVVCDETGQFVISLLSGHVGGANQLTEQIAAFINATPVITTASDVHSALNGSGQPENLVLGIGCRRSLSVESIERTATILLWDNKIPLSRVCTIATIDIKQDEKGLIEFAKSHNLLINFYTAGELTGVPGEFTASERVRRTVGVDNVCERAAVLCGGKGSLIIKKTTKDGVAIAVFEKEAEPHE